MGHTIPQALSQLDRAVPREPQHDHSLSLPIPTVQEVPLDFHCLDYSRLCVICTMQKITKLLTKNTPTKPSVYLKSDVLPQKT